MGLTPSECRLLIHLHKQIGFRGPVLTLGNQDVWATFPQLQSFFREMGSPVFETAVIPHTSNLFKLIMPEQAKDFVHARTFFGMMGIQDYWDLDKYDRDRPLILHDLNQPVPAEFEQKFNLIVDGGTIEHIFDVRQVMENIVRMCRESGWIIHLSPASNLMDHGFYSFSPSFFYDFYQANGFADMICYILQVNPNNYFEYASYFEYTYGMNMTQWLVPGRQVLVCFAARKVQHEMAVQTPTQAMYKAVNESAPLPPVRARLLYRLILNVRPLLGPFLPLFRCIRNTLQPPERRLKRI